MRYAGTAAGSSWKTHPPRSLLSIVFRIVFNTQGKKSLGLKRNTVSLDGILIPVMLIKIKYAEITLPSCRKSLQCLKLQNVIQVR